MPDLDSKLSNIPAKQAIRALHLLYDLAPPEAWEGGVKPPVARIETIMQRVQQEAPEETQLVVDALTAGSEEERGVLARYALAQYAVDERMRPAVERSVELAGKPDMAVDPLTLTAIVAFLVLASPEIKTRQGTRYTGGLVATIRALHVDKIAEQLPAIVKAIPETILARISGTH
jgi:hypothetical protein